MITMTYILPETLMRKKVLLIDDDVAILEALSIVLESEGYIPVVSTTGKNIVEKLENIAPSLILLDYSLVGETGGDISEGIKSNPKFMQIPIILISAVNNLNELAKDLKIDGFLSKPFSIEKLISILKRHIN